MQNVFGRKNWYCADAQTLAHPNGDVYTAWKLIDKSKGRNETWDVCITKYSNGNLTEVMWFKEGKAPWKDNFSAFSFAIMPDGTGIIFGGFRSQNIEGTNEQVVPQYFTVPNLAPAFSPQNMYTYAPTSADVYARELANRALSGMSENRSIANQALDKVKSYGDEAKKIVSDAVKKLQSITPAQIGVTEKSAKDIAWSIAGDRIFAEINNPASPLSNFTWSKAMDAAWATLKKVGLVK